MRLQEWEGAIQEIIDECNHEQKERGVGKIILKWRAKLGKEPTLLKSFQIDEIMREARQRLSKLGR